MRVCRYCLELKPQTEFDEFRRCGSCAIKKRSAFRIPIRIPLGWESPYTGIPDMMLPNEKTWNPSQEDKTWEASNNKWKLEILWSTEDLIYLCKINEKSKEKTKTYAFHYPHEVMDWLAQQFKMLKSPS